MTEERELVGRRRGLFTITDGGRDALRSWLAKPARHPTELRDLALLQLFFADLESTAATLAIAEEQLAWHRRQLATYEADRRFEDRLDDGQGISRTMQHWRGVTLRMGLLYERAAVEFWGEVAASVAPSEPGTSAPATKVEPGRRVAQPG